MQQDRARAGAAPCGLWPGPQRHSIAPARDRPYPPSSVITPAPGTHRPHIQVPEGYSRRLLNDMLDKHTGGMVSAGRRQRTDEDMFSGLEDELDWG